MEAGTVEVGVELRGNLSFPVDITVNVNFATAICKSNFNIVYTSLHIYYAMTLIVHHHS